ncbi:MAG TPA: hypothetical protein EYG98_01910 [Sulfurovum sp.]|nr:hypothetical protein [Sulfurovum sp.]
MIEKNKALVVASNNSDNDSIMELSKEVGILQQEIDGLFERLEIASEKNDEIVLKYDEKLAVLDE